MKKAALTLILLVAVAILVLPVFFNVIETGAQWIPANHPDFDGERYLLTELEQSVDAAGTSGVVAVLNKLKDLPAEPQYDSSGPSSSGPPPATAVEASPESAKGNVANRASRALQILAELGYPGRWKSFPTTDVYTLDTPFLVLLDADEADPTWFLVRRAFSGYVYGSDPAFGTVQYPISSFVESWNGMAFVFDDEPALAEYWHP